MTTSPNVQRLLDRATAVLPISDEDLIYKGIATSVAERMMVLKKAAARLEEQYGSLEELEQAIQTAGVPPDDHTRYTDLLEWRAIGHDLAQLQHIFETL
jgi:hypothetical protein